MTDGTNAGCVTYTQDTIEGIYEDWDQPAICKDTRETGIEDNDGCRQIGTKGSIAHAGSIVAGGFLVRSDLLVRNDSLENGIFSSLVGGASC